MQQNKKTLLTTKEVSEILHISPSSLSYGRCTGYGPAGGLPFVYFSRGCIRYRLKDIELFITKNLYTHPRPSQWCYE